MMMKVYVMGYEGRFQRQDHITLGAVWHLRRGLKGRPIFHRKLWERKDIPTGRSSLINMWGFKRRIFHFICKANSHIWEFRAVAYTRKLSLWIFGLRICSFDWNTVKMVKLFYLLNWSDFLTHVARSTIWVFWHHLGALTFFFFNSLIISTLFVKSVTLISQWLIQCLSVHRFLNL